MSSVSWLHLTDLHVGMHGQDWLLPNLKELLFEDLRRLHDHAGPWDFVVFSGDVAQTGAHQEFDKATEVLRDLWAHLKILGSTPCLIVTPGNHDLVRPLTKDPALRAMLHWHEDSQVREEFWSSAGNPYRQLIAGAFENFGRWHDALAIPKPSGFSAGILPGDSSCLIEKNGIRVGLVSLNSSFLQLTEGQYEERLELDVRQLVSACGGDHVKWASGLDAVLLVTHHPREWLHPSAQARFDSDVYPPRRFFVHFCGHLHEAAALNLSTGGAGLRRLRQGPSLFGLKYWGNKQERIHGYSAGQLSLTPSEIAETIWPRLARLGYAGHLRLVADQGYDLNQNDAVIWTYPRRSGSDVEQGIPDEDPNVNVLSRTDSDSQSAGVSLLEEVSEHNARAALDRVPRMQLEVEPHHRRIRRLEQATCEEHLEGGRCVWVLSDWGLGTDSFVASVILSLAERNRLRDLDAFAIQCDDASTIESFRGQVHRQLGLPLQQLLSFAVSLSQCVLVLENVTTDLLSDKLPDSGTTFDDVIRSILDYCPQIRIILTARSVPVSRFPYVTLKALELPDVRTYVLHHRQGGEKLAGADAVDTLYRRSTGLPPHLDRLLESLRYVNISELADSEFEDALESGPVEEVPRALERAVTGLAKSQDRYTRRSFKLLKVLTVLAEGETLQRLKYFDQTDPFYSKNASELEALQLVQIVQLADANPTSTQDNVGPLVSRPESLLVAPRQVRDYVRPSIHPREYSEIVKRGADLLFGVEWREGRLKNAYFRTAAAGQRNERIILKHLLSDAITRADSSALQRAGQLAACVCEGLNRKDRFRETIVIAEAVLPLLEESSSMQSKLDVASVHGKALRMLGRREEAIEILQRTLDEGGTHLSKRAKSSLFLNLALAHQANGDSEEAVAAAKQVHQFGRPGSGSYLQAEAIIAEETLSEQELITEWTKLERVARAGNHMTVANNIALDLAKSVGTDEAARLRERVIKSPEDGYNHIRAVVAKAKSQLAIEAAGTVSSHEKALLVQAYSYLHGQRMQSLFDTCHEVLWQLLRSEGRWNAVLRLFRHSSFVWRIYGKLVNEKRYVEELSTANLDVLRQSGGFAAADIDYFEGRRLEASEVVSG